MSPLYACCGGSAPARALRWDRAGGALSLRAPLPHPEPQAAWPPSGSHARTPQPLVCPGPSHCGGCEGSEVRGSVCAAWRQGCGSAAQPTSGLAAPGPARGCPEGRSAEPALLTQQGCRSVPARTCLCCWLAALSIGPRAPSVLLLSTASSGPAGPTLPPGGAGLRAAPRAVCSWPGPREAPLDMRAVLCGALPAPPSGPAGTSAPPEQGGLLASGQGCQSSSRAAGWGPVRGAWRIRPDAPVQSQGVVLWQ